MADFYTVSQINAYIKNIFSKDFALSRIRIKGEVSNCKYHQTGHVYFTLKDSASQINCVMFASDRASGLTFKLSDGQQIEASGRISVYEKTGSYQLYVRECRLSGAGELYEKYLELKNKLEDMGMFDELYKKPIPRYAMKIGIVTAPTGAAIQDIINISHRRNPYVELILYPALVQGAGAKESIVKGIETLDSMGLDIIIVGRGGGSIEDLWAFNEEAVANAIFYAETPVISAVGHETDFTIADFVADLRAPTPSGAAELANFEYDVFEQELSSYKESLDMTIGYKLQGLMQRLETYSEKLLRLSPEMVLNNKAERLKELKNRMIKAVSLKLERSENNLSSLMDSLSRAMDDKLYYCNNELKLMAQSLDSLSPLKKMSGGYGYLMTEKQEALNSISDIKAGETLTAYVTDGRISAVVTATEEMTHGSKG